MTPARTIGLPTGVVLVQLAGELDLVLVDELRAEFERALELSADVVVDCRGVTFMDCAVLGVLVGVSVRARSHQGSLCLVAPNRVVLRLLELSELTETLPVHPDLRSAAESLLVSRRGARQPLAR
jgi:anti-anti-sigma factor